jgi:hypothetical protein
MVLVGILLMVAGTTLAAPAGASGGNSTVHVAASSDAAGAMLQEARASAARGAGPGSVPAPSGYRTSAGPNISFGIVMTYDAFDGYVVAVSLNDSAGPANNTYGPTELTWAFTGGNWSLVTTVGQVPATLSPGLVYDAHDEYVLLYGGRLMDTSSPVAPLTNQTWSYQSGVWSNLSGRLRSPLR